MCTPHFCSLTTLQIACVIHWLHSRIAALCDMLTILLLPALLFVMSNYISFDSDIFSTQKCVSLVQWYKPCKNIMKGVNTDKTSNSCVLIICLFVSHTPRICCKMVQVPFICKWAAFPFLRDFLHLGDVLMYTSYIHPQGTYLLMFCSFVSADAITSPIIFCFILFHGKVCFHFLLFLISVYAIYQFLTL